MILVPAEIGENDWLSHALPGHLLAKLGLLCLKKNKGERLPVTCTFVWCLNDKRKGNKFLHTYIHVPSANRKKEQRLAHGKDK